MILKISPWSDMWQFLTHGGDLGLIFWALLLSSVVLAIISVVRYRDQRSIVHLWNWFARVTIAGLWWQQSLWKTPPTYGVAANGTGGLRFWMEQMVQNASTSFQSHLVANVMLPHFAFFAPQVYVAEVAIAILLMLGLFTRVAAVLGALLALNLWLGLYRSSSEWIWEYFFLLVIQVTFLIVRPGLSWGADVLICNKSLGRFDWLKQLA